MGELWTAAIGSDPLNIWLQRRRQDAVHARMLARIALEVGENVPQRPIAGATAGGDERKLRGIPAVGRGVAGAIRGTRPGDGLE